MSTDAQSKIKELEAKIQQLRGSQLSELQGKLREARQTVASLEAEITQITGKAPAAGTVIRRTRATSEEIRGCILKALAASPSGLSQKEIANATSLNYNTVVIFLKKNPKDFKTTGSLKNKRYYLK